MVTDIETFLKERGLGETDIEQAKRSTYKYTDCGAFLQTTEDSILVGSIVEGVDEGTETHVLEFPFEISEYWEALQAVEDEAAKIWNETHGCPSCGEDDECMYVPINPKCPVCHGEGIII